jgi:hypothetical protein
MQCLQYFSLWSFQMKSAQSESVGSFVLLALRSDPNASLAGIESSKTIVCFFLVLCLCLVIFIPGRVSAKQRDIEIDKRRYRLSVPQRTLASGTCLARVYFFSTGFALQRGGLLCR